MKTLAEYITEAEAYVGGPVVGDDIGIEIDADQLVESYILEVLEDGVVLDANDSVMEALDRNGLLTEEIRRYGAVGSSPGMGHAMGEQDPGPGDHLDAIENNKTTAQTDEGYINRMLELAGCQRRMEEDQDAEVLAKKELDDVITAPMPGVHEDELDMDEAKYQGREVPLGKPMQGDVKKFKVYVRDPKTGNIKKVNFGDKTMRIKKSDPARRKSFRARHNCDNPGPRTKARYWSCRKW